jgi:uncharacterized protein (TIGR02757 family)
MSHHHLKEQLDRLADKYNRPGFIAGDPISIPHRYSKKEDIEISAFLTSVIAWGNRRSIIRSAEKMMDMMDNSPVDFITRDEGPHLKPLSGFVHRTFNGSDLLFFVASLRNIYLYHGGLQSVFVKGFNYHKNIPGALIYFRSVFLECPHEKRSEKHIPDIMKNSAAKRLNMFLRWMVRQDDKGVDFGIWKNIPASSLLIPLDIHTASTARKMGLLTRKQNDMKAVAELTEVLKTLRPEDPVYYDFALFGAGIAKEKI